MADKGTGPIPNMQGPPTPASIRLEFTPEEEALMRKIRKELFYNTQLPCCFAATVGTYQLMKKGYIKKSGPEAAAFRFPAYFPKCLGAFGVTFIVSNIYVMRKIWQGLIEIDGSLSRQLKELRERNQVGLDTGFQFDKSSTNNNTNGPCIEREETTRISDESVVDSILNPVQGEPLPERSLTYEDLRRKNRLGIEDKSPPTQSYRPPGSKSPFIPEAKVPTNKYGDSWADS